MEGWKDLSDGRGSRNPDKRRELLLSFQCVRWTRALLRTGLRWGRGGALTRMLIGASRSSCPSFASIPVHTHPATILALPACTADSHPSTSR